MNSISLMGHSNQIPVSSLRFNGGEENMIKISPQDLDQLGTRQGEYDNACYPTNALIGLYSIKDIKDRDYNMTSFNSLMVIRGLSMDEEFPGPKRKQNVMDALEILTKLQEPLAEVVNPGVCQDDRTYVLTSKGEKVVDAMISAANQKGLRIPSYDFVYGNAGTELLKKLFLKGEFVSFKKK